MSPGAVLSGFYRTILRIFRPDFFRCFRCHRYLDKFVDDGYYRLCDDCYSGFPEWIVKVDDTNLEIKISRYRKGFLNG